MPTYLTGEVIAVGDWVRVYSRRFGVWHHGVVRRIYPVLNGHAVEIVHNMKASGVTASDWHDFSDGNQVILHRHALSHAHVREILTRLEFNLGKPYSLFDQNCEHFASFAFTRKAESKSVQAVGSAAAVLLVVILLTRG